MPWHMFFETRDHDSLSDWWMLSKPLASISEPPLGSKLPMHDASDCPPSLTCHPIIDHQQERQSDPALPGLVHMPVSEGQGRFPGEQGQLRTQSPAPSRRKGRGG